MEPTLDLGKNTGFIAVEPQPGDWMASAETGISPAKINLTSDWRNFLPNPQRQKLLGVTVNGGTGFETNACVSFSFEQVIATRLNFMVANGLLSDEARAFLSQNGYIDASGKVNFSPRFLAKVSGTTMQGNSLPAVAQAARNFGLVPDSMWPMPEMQIKGDPDNAWNIYYATIPQLVLNLGLEFKKHFQIQYDWVKYPGAQSPDLKGNLQVSPLQVATAVCPPWNTDAQIQGCGPGSAHGTELVYIDTGGSYVIFDHYVPFVKHFSPDYDITYAIRAVILPTPAPVPPVSPGFHHSFYVDLEFGATGAEVFALQKTLKIDGVFPSTVAPTGTFANVTLLAVQKFQQKYGIAKPGDAGFGRVGPKTRAKLNLLYA